VVVVLLLLPLLGWGGKARAPRGRGHRPPCFSSPGRRLTHQLSQHAQFPFVQRHFFFVVLALLPLLPRNGQHHRVYWSRSSASASSSRRRRRRRVLHVLLLLPSKKESLLLLLLLLPARRGGPHVDLSSVLAVAVGVGAGG